MTYRAENSPCRGSGRRAVLFVIVASLFFLTSRAAQAQSFDVVASFKAVQGLPFSSLVQASDGRLYGTTSGPSSSAKGSIFRLTPDGAGGFAFETLYLFSGPDGKSPQAGLIQASDGNFYGTTALGGAFGYGTVFRFTPAGALTTLHSFASSDGATPVARLVQASDGNLYGTTREGGAGYGTVFRIATSGAFTSLYSFVGTDGANPYAGLIQATDGRLYGTTRDGGPDFGMPDPIYGFPASATAPSSRSRRTGSFRRSTPSTALVPAATLWASCCRRATARSTAPRWAASARARSSGFPRRATSRRSISSRDRPTAEGR